MKNYRLLITVSLTALILIGCGFGKMVSRYPEVKVALENPDLENKGGKVDYKVTGKIPQKYMKKKATMTITPTLEYNGITYSLTPIKLRGEKAKDASGTTIPFKAGGSFSNSGSFDFKPEYEDASIVANVGADLKKKHQDFPPIKLGEGVSNTSSRAALSPTLSEKSNIGNGSYIIFADHEYKPEFITNTGTIYFEVNKWDMNWNLKLNKDEKAKTAIKDFIAFMNEGRKIEKVVVTGWASPEGEESRNQGLSVKRYEQGKKWFQEQFNKYLKDYAKKNKIKEKDMVKPALVFEIDTAGEDWTGFELAVEKSNIAEKSQILNVVRSQKDPATREQKIREMTDIYKEISDVILPPLRRSEMSLICNKNNFNDQQIAQIVKTAPDSLSLNERLYAAFMTSDLNEKEKVYKDIVAQEKNQKDWRAYNNLAAIQLNKYINEKGDASMLSEAKNNLNKANAISPNNGIILNNMAIAEFISGNIPQASTKMQEAQNASINSINENYNLGMTKIALGDYSSAQQMMNNKNCDYNMALLQILEKNYENAKKNIECIPNKDAKVYYLAAILAARTNNEADVYTNLKQAIQKDPKYIVTAKKDAEFKKYKNSREFKDIVK